MSEMTPRPTQDKLASDAISPDKLAPDAGPDTPPAFYPSGPASPTPTSGPAHDGWIKYPPRLPVTVLMQPEEKTIELPKPKTARAVLQALGLRECTALLARNGELLTPDRAIAPGDHLLVRKVTSSG